MKKEELKINEYNTNFYNRNSDKVIIAIHGAKSNKDDFVFDHLAKIYNEEDIVIVDMPYSTYQNNPLPLKEQKKILDSIYDYLRHHYNSISLFAVSIGCFNALYSYGEKTFDNVMFLSPIVNMKKLLNEMLNNEGITPGKLKELGTLKGNDATYYYEDYELVMTKQLSFDSKVYVLYGNHDELQTINDMMDFAAKVRTSIRRVNDAHHFFHTDSDLAELDKWLKDIKEDSKKF